MTMKAFSRMASWRAGIKAGGLIQRFIQLALRRPNAVLAQVTLLRSISDFFGA
jgi:hypothetical protein